MDERETPEPTGILRDEEPTTPDVGEGTAVEDDDGEADKPTPEDEPS